VPYPKPVGLIKTAAKVLVILLVAAVPALIFTALGWSGALTVGFFGVIAAASATIVGGVRTGVVISALVAVGAVLGLLVREQPGAVALLMVLLGGGYGWIAARGVGSGALMLPALVPYFIEQPPQLFGPGPPTIDAPYLGALVIVVLVSGVWTAWLIGTVIMKSATRLSSPTPLLTTVGYGMALGAAAGIAAGIALRHAPQTHWAWLTLTIFVLADPSGKLDRRKVRDRLLGTFVGFIAALGLLQLPTGAMWTAFFGLTLLTLALTVRVDRRPYWVYVALLTPVIIIVSASSGQADRMAGERLWFTVLGAIIVLSMTVLLNFAYANTIAKRKPSVSMK
jgi:hypothetical protein